MKNLISLGITRVTWVDYIQWLLRDIEEEANRRVGTVPALKKVGGQT